MSGCFSSVSNSNKIVFSYSQMSVRSWDSRHLIDSSFKQIWASMPALEPTTANEWSCRPVTHSLFFLFSPETITGLWMISASYSWWWYFKSGCQDSVSSYVSCFIFDIMPSSVTSCFLVLLCVFPLSVFFRSLPHLSSSLLTPLTCFWSPR